VNAVKTGARTPPILDAVIPDCEPGILPLQMHEVLAAFRVKLSARPGERGGVELEAQPTVNPEGCAKFLA
jgi:hypothetical protein